MTNTCLECGDTKEGLARVCCPDCHHEHFLGILTIAFNLSGGLNGLKSSTIIGSLPFIFIMFLGGAALVKDLVSEKAYPRVAVKVAQDS